MAKEGIPPLWVSLSIFAAAAGFVWWEVKKNRRDGFGGTPQEHEKDMEHDFKEGLNAVAAMENDLESEFPRCDSALEWLKEAEFFLGHVSANSGYASVDLRDVNDIKHFENTLRSASKKFKNRCIVNPG